MSQDNINREEIAESIFGKSENPIMGSAESDESALAIETDKSIKAIEETQEKELSDNSDVSGGVEEDAYVLIDPSAIGRKDVARITSLTDLNDIPLFTDEYERNVAAVDERNRLRIERLKGTLFLEEKEKPDRFEGLWDVLFREKQSEVIKKTFEPERDSAMGEIISVAAFSVMVLIFILAWFERRSRKRREDADNNYSYTN